MNGILSGFNEQRGADTNYLAQLDAMRRAAVAQELDKRRMQQQQEQFAQEMAMRQQQSAQSNDLDRARMQQQAQQYAQNAALQRAEFGLKERSQTGEMNRQEQARNALASILNGGGDINTTDLGRAILQYDPTTGINLIKAGKEEQRQQALLDRTGGTGVSAPQNYRWTKDGNLEYIPGGAADPQVLAQMEAIKGKAPKALTEDQGKATGWFNRMKEAENIITNAPDSAQTSGGSVGSLAGDAVRSLPFIGHSDLGNSIANALTPVERQKVQQAQESWVQGLLRSDTGASYKDMEKADIIRTFFPQPNEGPEIAAQKERARAIVQDSMRVRSGPGADMSHPLDERQSTSSTWQDSYKSKAQAVSDALEAVRRGAPRDAVRQRLKQIGIDDARL